MALRPESSAPQASDPIASFPRPPLVLLRRASRSADFRVWHHRRVRGICCRCQRQTLVPSLGFPPLRDLPHAVGIWALARIRSRVPYVLSGSEDPDRCRFASVRRSVHDLAIVGLPGVLYVKEQLDLGVGLARKLD